MEERRRGGRMMSTVGSFGIARLRPSRAAYAEHAAEAAPPALRRAPSTATDVPVIVFHFQPLFRCTVFSRIYKRASSTIVSAHSIESLSRNKSESFSFKLSLDQLVSEVRKPRRTSRPATCRSLQSG